MSQKNYQGSGSGKRSAFKTTLALLAVVFVVSGMIVYTPSVNWLVDRANGVLKTQFGHVNRPFVLGLDLQGGTRLEYEADVSKIGASQQASSLEGVRDVIERRVNAMGVSEPIVQTTKAGDSWRVSVELAGVRDINQAIKMIGETPILEFKEQNDAPAQALTDEQRKQILDSAVVAKADAQKFLDATKADAASFEVKLKEQDLAQEIKDKNGDVGFIKDNYAYQTVYEAAKNSAVGQILPAVVDMGNAEAVVKVLETKDAGQEVKARHILIQYAGSAQAPTTTVRTKDEAKALAAQIKSQGLDTANFADKAKEFSEEPGAIVSGGDLGWFAKGEMVEAFENAVFAMSKGQVSEPVESEFGFHLILKEDERPLNDVRVAIMPFKKLTEQDVLPAQDPWKNTELTGKYLSSAILDFDQRSGAPVVSLEFNDEGAKLFADITKRNVGKLVAIFLDGEVISAPTVNEEILGGKAIISSQTFTVQEAKLLAQRLQAGALPVPINLIAQQSVGPSLGQDSVQASLVAGLWGFILVALFMIIIYRLPGLLSVLSLTFYALLLLAIFKIVPVTLTLSGIAGLILSVGMAVDANVLIFERLKEELKLGKAYGMAIEEAFRRAWPSIRDGNITTLISCAVLFIFTSSVIKGFALTLGIGVVISMFSAIVVTRSLLRVMLTEKIVKMLGWFMLKPREKSANE